MGLLVTKQSVGGSTFIEKDKKSTGKYVGYAQFYEDLFLRCITCTNFSWDDEIPLVKEVAKSEGFKIRIERKVESKYGFDKNFITFSKEIENIGTVNVTVSDSLFNNVKAFLLSDPESKGVDE